MTTKRSIGIIYSVNRKVFIKPYTDDQPTNIFWGLKELVDRGHEVAEFQPLPVPPQKKLKLTDYIKWIHVNKHHLNKLDFIVTYNQTCTLSLCLLRAIKVIKAKIIIFHLGVNIYSIDKNKLKYEWYKLSIKIYNRYAHTIAVRSNYEKAIYDKMVNSKSSKFWFARQGVNTSYYFPVEKDNNILLIVGNNPNRDWNQVYKLASVMPDMQVIVASHTFKGDTENLPPNLLINKSLTLAESRKLFSKAGFLLVQTLPNTHLSGSTTMLAGLASGCVVIMDDLTALDDYYLVNGKNMVGIERGNIDIIVNRINELRASPQLLTQMQSAATALSSVLNIEAMADDLEMVMAK